MSAMADPRFDPLSELREGGEEEFDVFTWGTVFLDIIFSGLERLPAPGAEEWAGGMASCPGGVANLAVAARRLGLRTALAAAFGDDDYGDFCWRTLAEQEHVDLTRSRRFEGWHSPVTVSMSVHNDRSMVTHEHPAPMSPDALIGRPPRAKAVIVDLAACRAFGSDDPTWVELARADGSLVFADLGWDPSGSWPASVLDHLGHCHAFTPNAAEAMAYTRTATPQEALYAIADLVPLAVVTNGPEGALAIDSGTGEECRMPALRVQELDPTGAGDVFAAALVLGTLKGWPLHDRLAFSTLCSGLAMQQYGGSLAAPGWGDIADWWTCLRESNAKDAYSVSVRRRYSFLEGIVTDVPAEACRRATATIARLADTPGFA